MKRLIHLLAGASLLLALGCPEVPDPEGERPDQPAEVESQTDGTDEPSDPLAGSLFTKEQLFEIYGAEQRGGAERTKVLRKHRLLDAEGAENRKRVAAYEDALKRYASGDPEGWADFVQSLTEAR